MHAAPRSSDGQVLLPGIVNWYSLSTQITCAPNSASRLMPAWRISLLHSLQGECVRYNVAPRALLVLRATFRMALASGAFALCALAPTGAAVPRGGLLLVVS